MILLNLCMSIVISGDDTVAIIVKHLCDVITVRESYTYSFPMSDLVNFPTHPTWSIAHLNFILIQKLH